MNREEIVNEIDFLESRILENVLMFILVQPGAGKEMIKTQMLSFLEKLKQNYKLIDDKENHKKAKEDYDSLSLFNELKNYRIRVKDGCKVYSTKI